MRHALAALAVLLLPLAAAAQQDATNPIIARMIAFTEAYNTQDAAMLATFYTPDAILLAPGERAIVGQDAIAAHYANAFAAGARDLQFMTFDIRPFDQMAVEIGETVVMVGAQRIVGRYMHLWEVVGDEILLTRDMYHILLVE
jgi:uncharacterized protein (TIGR02246 family)